MQLKTLALGSGAILSPADGTIENVTMKYGTYNYTGGVYTGLYNITVDGTKYMTFCIDPLGDIKSGDTWNANHLSSSEIMAGNGELFSNAYPNTGVASQKYAMINYLAEKSFYLYTSTPDNRLNTASERSDLSLLFWEIALNYNGSLNSMTLTNGNFSSSSTPMNGTLSGLLSEAYTHRNDQITMSIYTPTDRPSQEFLAFKPANVPEPGMISLFLIGLSSLGFSRLFRRKK